MKPNGNLAVKTTATKEANLVVTKGAKAETQTAPQTPTTEEKKVKEPTVQDLKDRATIVYLLQEKHTKLIDKRTSLDRFAIKHENENARITVEDANGEEFHSSSPKTIAKLIEFWKEEFDEAISDVENKLKKVFNGEKAC